MKPSRSVTWVIGTVVVGLALLAAGWFFAIAPQLSAASATRAQTDDVTTQNQTLQTKIAKLKEQKAQIATYQAQLASLRQQLPATASTSALLRQLQTQADATGVTVISVTPGTPTTFDKVAAATTTSSADQSAAAASDSDSTASTAKAASTASTGLVAIPLAVDVIGTYSAATNFLTAVQGTDARLYLVTSVSLTSQQEAAASGGRPATSPGDAELQLTGFVLTLPETTTTAGATTTAPTMPAAVPGKNPLVPIG